MESEEVEPSPEPEPKPRRRWQFGTRGLLLLVAAVAAWSTFFVNRREIPRLEAKIAKARPFFRELVVNDPKKAAVVRLDDLWYDETRWDLYLPEGSYQLKLASRKIDEEGFPEDSRTIPFPAGRHRLELLQRKAGEGSRIEVVLDGKEFLTVDEGNDWAGDASFGGSEFSDSRQVPSDKPIVLFRRRQYRYHFDSNGVSTSPSGPTVGLMLWIEPTPAEKPAP